MRRRTSEPMRTASASTVSCHRAAGSAWPASCRCSAVLTMGPRLACLVGDSTPKEDGLRLGEAGSPCSAESCSTARAPAPPWISPRRFLRNS